MPSAIDLYSGIGGWTLGMKLSGVDNLASFEWWKEANLTHNINFNTNHQEVDIRKIKVEEDLNFKQKIDFVVGSPPCTQFSFANRGGNGDIQDGLIDIFKFLEIVDFLKPKYWAMENVPRVAQILEKELQNGSLRKFKHLISTISVVDASDYGVPQSRKRMIAGNFPVDLFFSYKEKIEKKTLGKVIQSLSSKKIVDPNYGYIEDRQNVTELDNEANLTLQEIRINRDAKTYHPIYNRMSFPENLDRPSRTITATCTRVSRESIIINSETGFRRLNVRERGVIQGFPITYQFYGRTLNSKFKMIGNAVPPILTYYIFQSMLETSLDNLKQPSESIYKHKKPNIISHKSKIELPKSKFSSNRRFQFSVPNLRFGSGVRFELSNFSTEDQMRWSFKFFYGNSKDIKEVALSPSLKDFLAPIVNTTHNHVFTECADNITRRFKHFNSESLQKAWTSETNSEVFDFLDNVGECVDKIISEADFDNINFTLLEHVLKRPAKKLEKDIGKLITGFYLLSTLNSKILD